MFSSANFFKAANVSGLGLEFDPIDAVDAMFAQVVDVFLVDSLPWVTVPQQKLAFKAVGLFAMEEREQPELTACSAGFGGTKQVPIVEGVVADTRL